jgi:integrase
MASIQKRINSPFWWASFKNVHGKWCFRSTKTMDEITARSIAEKWEQTPGPALVTEQQARRVMQEQIKSALGSEITLSTTPRKYVEHWLKSREGTMKLSSFRFYSSTLACWVRGLGALADRDMNALSTEHLIEWRNAEAKRVAVKTVNHRLKAVRAICAAATKADFMRKNPALDLHCLKAPTGRLVERARRPFTMEEIASLDAIMSEEWRVILTMGLFTGQRLGDILTFEWKDINFAKQSLFLVTSKTRKAIWLPVAPELLARLKNWHGETQRSRYLFPDWAAQVHRGEGLVGRASNRFAHYLWKAGLRTHSPFGRDRAKERAAKAAPKADRRRQQQELSFHSLRHTARTVMAEAGVPKDVIDAYIGHDSEMGRDYTTVGQNALREAASALSARAAKDGLLLKVA